MHIYQHINKTIYLFICAGISALTILVNTAVATEGSCFNNVNISPTFLAFSSKEGSQLGLWYKKVFGVKTVKSFSFPDGSTTGELMKIKDLGIEVFYHKELPDGPKKAVGVMKAGIYLDTDLKKLKQCLLNNDIKAGRIFRDENLHIDLLYVLDSDGNGIELISKFTK